MLRRFQQVQPADFAFNPDNNPDNRKWAQVTKRLKGHQASALITLLLTLWLDKAAVKKITSAPSF